MLSTIKQQEELEFVIEYVKTTINNNADNPEILSVLLHRLVKTYGYAKMAEKIGVTRGALYKMFYKKNTIKLDIAMKILQVCGLTISVALVSK